MRISRGSARFLVGVGAWNWVIWLDFARRLVGDEGRETAFYVVHAVLIVVSIALGTGVALVGWRALRSPDEP